MRESLNGIVLNVVKVSDRNNIAHVYTRERGLMSLLVRQGTSRASRQRAALMMPLQLIAFEAHARPGQELAMMGEARRTMLPVSIMGDPVKTAIALFMGELLTRVIQEHERNEALYAFLEGSVRLLEEQRRGVANFHICFLFRLGRFIGIEPDTGGYAHGRWFDMDEGVFVGAAVPAHHMLAPAEARVIHLLSRMTFANMHLFRFNRHERNAMLDTIIAYYRLHNSALGTLRSPQVLQQLFT